ncbi:Na+/H+ antiporter subunit E [Demequina sp.]|uniref:Na+/H+ antiporter subunit E n=1 Tax=Demequina sp. TaxID=2050685 RepID=UPI003A89AF44
MAKRERLKAVRQARRYQIPLQISLVALWIFLWGTFDVTTLVSGVLLAVLVPLVFYLPPIEASGRIHVGWLAWFIVVLMWDITRSSVIVAGQALGIGYSPKEAIIGVRLRSRSDLIMTATAQASTLVPGTLVIDVDRARAELFVHVFCVTSDEGIDKARREVLATEERLIMAIGTRAEVRKVQRDRARESRRKVTP